MTIWKGRTPSYEHWKAEVQHERRAMGDFKPPFADEHDAKKRYNFLVRIGFFQTTKET